MRYRGLSWKLILGNALLMALGLGLGGWLFAANLTSRVNALALSGLADEAGLLAGLLTNTPHNSLQEQLAAGGATDPRIAVLSSAGEFLAVRGIANAAELRTWPEIEAARRWEVAAGVRDLAGVPHLVAAASVTGMGDSPAVLCLARPAWSWRAAPHVVIQLLLLVIAVALFLSLLLAWFVARAVRRPLRRLAEHAARLTQAGERPPAVAMDNLPALAQSLEHSRSQLSAQMEAEQRQRSTLEALLAQIREGVIAADAEGRIVLINPTAVRLLQLIDTPGATGAERGRLIGQSIERCIPQHDILQLLQMRDRSGEEPLSDEAELRVDAPTGVRHVLARGTDLYLSDVSSESRTVEGRVVVLTDISELVKTGQVKTDFVANASHELRTPLSTIRASIEALTTMDLREEHEAAARFLGVIDRQSARLAAMVSDLLDLSQLESQATTYKPQQLRWRDIARDLRERFAERVAAKELSFTVELPPSVEDEALFLPPYLLSLVLDNLVDNAIKFTPAGGAVSVGYSATADKVLIEVTDTGCGIPAEEQERVFERFYQVERARSGPDRGTGLGLSIVRHAVAALAGSIELSSRVGHGTRFAVTLARPLEEDGM